jgi:topoisomerase IV subunit B
VDGLHIRNLMITYFFRFFDQLVHDGHVYVLETPLFRVRNKEKTIYCYSEAERDAARRRNWGQACEITRFKGLGEISPKEFKQFIGKTDALEPGGIRAARRVRAGILGFLHGQEHAGAEGLHHGQPGRAGGGVIFRIADASARRLNRRIPRKQRKV